MGSVLSLSRELGNYPPTCYLTNGEGNGKADEGLEGMKIFEEDNVA